MIVAERDFHQAQACRGLWAAVVLAVLNDFRHEAWRGRRDAAELARVRQRAVGYFGSRSWRDVATLAGIEPDGRTPEAMADLAMDVAWLQSHGGAAAHARAREARA